VSPERKFGAHGGELPLLGIGVFFGGRFAVTLYVLTGKAKAIEDLGIGLICLVLHDALQRSAYPVSDRHMRSAAPEGVGRNGFFPYGYYIGEFA